MKIRHHRGLLVAAFSAGLGAHSALVSGQTAPPTQRMFMCTEEGSVHPQFLAWTDADQQLFAISVLREESKVRSEAKVVQHAHAQNELGVRTVKAGYHIVNADKQPHGILVVSSTRYGCVPSYED